MGGSPITIEAAVVGVPLTEGDYLFQVVYTPVNQDPVTQTFALNVEQGAEIRQVIDANDIEFTAAACHDYAYYEYSFSIYDCEGFDADELSVDCSSVPGFC